MWKWVKMERTSQVLRESILLFSLILMGSAQVASEERLFLGPTYPILEPDWREWLPKQLERKISHDPGAWRRKLEDSVRRQIPQWDLPEVTISSTRMIDPTVTLQKPAFDRSGRLSMVPVTVNPLAMVPFSRPILIFDGRKERQVQFAIKFSNQPMVILITAGSPLSLSHLFRQPVYPASQEILTRFEITRVPAFLQLQDKAIRLDEIVP